MKLTFVLYFVALMQVSASSFGQTITLNKDNVSLEESLNDVHRQSGFSIFYDAKMIRIAKRISLHINNASLQSALDEMFRDQPFNYIIQNNTIVVTPKPQVTPAQQVAQAIVVTGHVTDSKGAPLPGVSVKVKGTSTGAVTDNDGKYTITANNDAVLIFSFIGFAPQEIKVGSRTHIDIEMTEQTSNLNDVVVVGYATEKRTDVSGAIVTVQAKDIQNPSVSNPLQSLEGRVPGLLITQGSGAPGQESMNMTIRGPNSFASDNSPLVLINGVVGDITLLDPSFIESVTVLKDGAAAIYGARAANGVILVTTKTGANESKLNIDFNSSYVNQTAINQPARVWNSVQFMNMWNTSIANAGGGANPYPQSIIDLYQTPSAQYPSTNWWNLVVKPVNIFNNTLSIGGKSGNTNYHAGMGVWDQDGIVQGFNYQKFTGMFSMDSQVSKAVKFGVSVNGAANNTKQPWDGVNDILLSLFDQTPTYGPYLLDGSGRVAWRSWSEEWPGKPPLANASNGGQWNNNFSFNGTAYIQVKILPELTWEIKGGMQSSTTNMKTQTPVIPIYNFQTNASEGYSNGNQTISLTQENDDLKYYTAYSTLNYAKTFFKDFNLAALLGASEERQVSTMLQGYRYGFASQSIDVLNGGPTNGETNAASESDYALRSLFGRFNLNYKSKYYIEVDARRDGSSRFPPDNKYAVFPSFLGSWRLSQEPFIAQNLLWISELKLRASYGTLGNDNVNGNYPYQSLIVTGANYPFASQGGVIPGALSNSDLKWESTTTKNLGLDFNIKNSAIYGSFDYFDKTTSGILRQEQLAAYTGSGSPYVNEGVVNNKGLEIVLGHKQRIGGFTFGIEGNISAYRNKLVKFGAQEINGNTIMKEGDEINRFYVYQADGIYQSQAEINAGPSTPWVTNPGDIRFKDVNGDGKITPDDRVAVNGANPNFYYGVNLTASWKGFDLAVLLQGSQGEKGLVQGERSNILPFSSDGAPLVWWEDSWTPQNHSTTKPIMDYYYGPNGTAQKQASTFWLEDLSYMRVKNVSLGYTLPAALTKKADMQKVRFYLNAYNLFTITKYPFGDPENPSNGGFYTYPLMRSLTCGVDVTF